ncbi:MAG: serine/threonine-protein kinase [Sandaracinus sp.]
MTVSGPRSFGKYLLEREIARGGMARVHLATLRGLGGFEKKLVVKEILPELARDPKFVAMFVEEAKVLVALSHPNIVPVYELGIVDGTYFLAMEHVEGATLAELVQSQVLAPAEAARVGAQIADALAYAHERFEIVHRDVSPRNVMVDTAGHARLLDFGIAARADVGDESEALYGTPGFLSPEQARGEKLGPASDLFSLGCVLVYALTGKSPVDAKDLESLRALAKVPALAAETSREPLASRVRELLAPTASERPASARAVARSLAAAASALEHDEGASATLAARAVQARERSSASETTHEEKVTGVVTPGRVEVLAKSQALDAILGTAKLERSGETPLEAPAAPAAESEPAARDEGEPAPSTARIERARTRASTTEPSGATAPTEAGPAALPRWPALLAAAVAAALAVWLVSGARFELTPTPPIDPIDHGVTSAVDIEPLVVLDEDAGPIDAGVADDAALASDAALDGDAGVDAAGPRRVDAGAATARGSASLRVTAIDWANVSLDGRPLGQTPIRGVSVSAGPHTLVLDNPALGRHVERRFRAEPGDALVVSANMTTSPPTVTGP